MNAEVHRYKRNNCREQCQADKIQPQPGIGGCLQTECEACLTGINVNQAHVDVRQANDVEQQAKDQRPERQRLGVHFTEHGAIYADDIHGVAQCRQQHEHNANG